MSIERSRRAMNGGVRIAVVLAMAAGAVWAASPHPASTGASMPALVESIDPERPWPVFVAAELAVTPSGAVAEDLFDLGTVWTIQHALETLRDPMGGDCIPWGEAYHFGPTTPHFDSVADLVTHSTPIVRGRVVGSRPGFSSGVPGQLLKIEVLEQLKADEGLSYAYVFFPVGRLEVGEQAICKTDVRYARVPEEGTEILVLAQGLREEAAEPFFRLPDNGTGIVVLSDGGDDRDLPELLREENPGKGGRHVLRDVLELLESRSPGLRRLDRLGIHARPILLARDHAPGGLYTDFVRVLDNT